MAGSAWTVEEGTDNADDDSDEDCQTMTIRGPVKRWLMRAALMLSAVVGLMATGLISIGTYLQEHYTATPHLTGSMRAPAATIGWGVIMTTAAPTLQMIARSPKKKNVATATTILGIITLGMALTTIGITTATGATAPTVEANLRQYMAKYGDQENIDAEIDNIQESYHCCGTDNPLIYQEADSFLHGRVPASCCRHKLADCGLPPVGNTIYPEGCSSKLADSTIEALTITAMALAMATGTLAAITMGLASCWMCAY